MNTAKADLQRHTAAGSNALYLPFALECKYRNADREWVYAMY
jgi:hypothetical protein